MLEVKMYDDVEFRKRNENFGHKKIEFIEIEMDPDTAFLTGAIYEDDMICSDEISGRISTGYLMAAMASLTQKEHLSKWVIRASENETELMINKANNGISFHFFHCGKWVKVTVDKYLPSSIGSYSRRDTDLWIPYLEKAYAKFHRTYTSIKGGLACFAMVDLTGGIAIHNELKGLTWNFLKNAKDGRFKTLNDLFFLLMDDNKKSDQKLNENYIMTSALIGESESKNEYGLLQNHEYTVVEFELVVNRSGDEIQLVRLRNPWGFGDWNGKWAYDDDTSWSSLEKTKVKLLKGRMHHNGSFWMEFSDWVTIFDSFDICHIPSSSHPESEEPCFHREERCSGQFGSNGTITFQLKVGARRNIFLQTLLDTRASYISNFCCSKLILKDSKGKIIRPRLPLQYPDTDGCGYWKDKNKRLLWYRHNGYLYNIKEGVYTIQFTAVNSMSLQPVKSDMNWCVRAVSKSSRVRLKQIPTVIEQSVQK